MHDRCPARHREMELVRQSTEEEFSPRMVHNLNAGMQVVVMAFQYVEMLLTFESQRLRRHGFGPPRQNRCSKGNREADGL